MHAHIHSCTHTHTQVDFLEISVVTVTDSLYQKTGSDTTGGLHSNQITVAPG